MNDDRANSDHICGIGLVESQGVVPAEGEVIHVVVLNIPAGKAAILKKGWRLPFRILKCPFEVTASAHVSLIQIIGITDQHMALERLVPLANPVGTESSVAPFTDVLPPRLILLKAWLFRV